MKNLDNTNQTKRTDIYWIDPHNIVVIPNFNARRDFQLDELKEQIKECGVLNPVTVIPFKDEDGFEKYRLVDGERRLRATLLAIEEGSEIQRIKAIFLPRNYSEEQMLIEQMMRNEGKNFTEYECAIMFNRFKEQFGYTQTEIASKFKKSDSFISRCLSLMELAPEIQQKMAEGSISPSAVRQIVEHYKGNEKAQIKAVEDAVNNATTHGKKKATSKNASPELKAEKNCQRFKSFLEEILSLLEEKKASEVTLEKLMEALKDAKTFEQIIPIL